MSKIGIIFLVFTLCVGISYISPVFGQEMDIQKSQYLTRPTFGLSHEQNIPVVDYGFSFNNNTFAITDNFHTPFQEQDVNVGEVNTFEAKVFSEHGLRVQEFLFGIPERGQAHLAEVGVEVWYDIFGEVQQIKVIQKSNVVDETRITATHEMVKCRSYDFEAKCDTTILSLVFLEPLKDKVMAIKAIDNKNRYQITYLNEGFDVQGESLNPMKTVLIPSNVRDNGLIQVTQIAKYSNLWVADDGRLFEKNDSGSFKQINQIFDRFQDSGVAKTRLHSGFEQFKNYEKLRALEIFNSTSIISELPESFTIYNPIGERIDDAMKQEMIKQEQIAQKNLELSKQARFY